MIIIDMSAEDKYRIQEAIDKHFKNPGVLDVSDRHFGMKSIAAIWEEVYVQMPLKDTEYNDIGTLLEAIKTITGESSLKVEQS